MEILQVLATPPAGAPTAVVETSPPPATQAPMTGRVGPAPAENTNTPAPPNSTANKLKQALAALPPEQESPDEHEPYLLAAERMATNAPDRQMTDALLLYMLTHRSPRSAVPARALGRVFVEQTDTFIKAFRAQPVLVQVAIWPYLEFGYGRALKGKNRSIMKYKRAQKRFDALSASMMNAGR